MLAHNVAALLKSPPGTTRDILVHEPAPRFEPDLVVRAPVQGSVRLTRTQEGVLARGEVAAALELVCSRCITPFTVTLTVPFAEVYRPTVDVFSGAPLAPAEDQALQISERHVLDLSETVRQYLLTAIPLKPVCSPDCRGLCPTCGTDLNTGTCSCELDETASPFAVLGSLLVAGGEPEGRSQR